MRYKFSKSNGAKEFENFYRNKVKNEDKPLFLYPVKVDNFDRTFRWKRFRDAENLAEQVVGSFENGTAERVDNKLVFRVENTMGLNSLFYGRPLREHTKDLFEEPIELFGERLGDLHMTIEWEVPWNSK